MPRGFKKDFVATSLAHINKQLSDPRSFISLPKHTHGDEAVPHLILYGLDKGPIRAEIFRRDRENHHLAGMDINRCRNCGKRVFESGWIGRNGEWDHILSKAGQRCDCPENGRVVCRACHRASHKQVMFSTHRK